MKPRRSLCLGAAAALVLVVLSGAACDVVFQGMNAQETEEWKRTYKLDEGGQVDVTTPNGEVDISPSADGTTVEVVAVKRARATSPEAAKQALKGIEITEQATAKQIRLEVPRVRGEGGMHIGRESREVRFTLKVPKSASVKVNTRNGGIRVSGVAGAVRIDSTNGNIVGEDLGGAVQAGTTNGNVTVRVTRLLPDGIRLDTTNGSIDLQVPADTKANISAHWANGNFEARGLNPQGESERRRYEGKLNGGGPLIEMNTTNGRIRISS